MGLGHLAEVTLVLLQLHVAVSRCVVLSLPYCCLVIRETGVVLLHHRMHLLIALIKKDTIVLLILVLIVLLLFNSAGLLLWHELLCMLVRIRELAGTFLIQISDPFIIACKLLLEPWVL